MGVPAAGLVLRERDRRHPCGAVQREPAHAPAFALDTHIPIRRLVVWRQAGFGKRHDVLEWPELDRLLAPQPEGPDEPQACADMAIEGAYIVDQGVDVDPLGRPALVALGVLVALVLVHHQAVIGGAAHEAVFAHPHAQPAQEAQVGLDGGRGQVILLPNLHHGADVLLPQVARVGHGLEAGLEPQVAEEAPQEVRAFVPRLVRHRLLQRGVQRVEELDQHFEHLLRRCLARRVARQNFLRRLARPTLAARGLVLGGPSRTRRLLTSAAGCRWLGFTVIEGGHGRAPG